MKFYVKGLRRTFSKTVWNEDLEVFEDVEDEIIENVIYTNFGMNFRFNFSEHSFLNKLEITDIKIDEITGEVIVTKSRKGRSWDEKDVFAAVEEKIEDIAERKYSRNFAIRTKDIVISCTLEECVDEESTYIINIKNVLAFKGKDSSFIHISTKKVKIDDVIMAC